MNKIIPGLAWLVLAVGCGQKPVAPVPNDVQLDQGTTASDRPPALVNSIDMKLVLIPSGEFEMGSADSDPLAREDEKPQHRVRITKPFYLGAHEVMQGEYEKVMGTNPSFFSPTGPDKDRVKGLDPARFPVEQVSWHEAMEFCRRLSGVAEEKAAGHIYRLPTEAEWEYACRAGTTTNFHWGDTLASAQANFNGEYPCGQAPRGPFLLRPTEVGSYSANPWGLHDVHGNVWEWCADWHDPDYYKNSPTDDPAGPPTGTARVIRGGDWRSEGSDCRSAFRYADMPWGRYYVVGFRVVMTLGESSAPSARESPPAVEPGKAQASSAAVPPELLTAGEDWPHWRGPRGDGTWAGPKLPERWPATGLRRYWRQPIGGGYAGPVVANGRVYVHDHLKESQECERVLCFDAATGQLVWKYQYPVQYGKLEYGNGPRATPAVVDRRIYTLGAVGDLYCLDALTGKRFWSVNLIQDFHAELPLWAFAGSPVIFDDWVIIHAGAPDGCMIAFDRRTGREVWRNLSDGAGYATPVIVNHRGAPLLVCWTPINVRGLDPRTGKLLWTIPFEVRYGTAIATPICQDDIVLVSSYWDGAKAIRLGNGLTQAQVIWQDRRELRALMSAPLYRDGYAYLLDIRQGLTCFELKTGKKLWVDHNRMTPKGRNPQATLVWLGDSDRAVILNSAGELLLARLNAQGYREQSRTQIIGPTWAHPAYTGACVFARDDQELVCVSLVEAGFTRK